MAFGGNRIAIGWTGTGLSVLGLLIIMSMGDSESLVGCCFWLVVSILITSSGYEAKKKAANLQKVVYIQQPPVQQVVHHTYQQAPVAQPRPAPTPVPKTSTHTSPAKSQAEWAMDARNLEMARDWERAAQAYQKAGLYAEAGRIRQQYMEKDESGVNIQIQGGDTIHDSVIMRDDDSNL